MSTVKRTYNQLEVLLAAAFSNQAGNGPGQAALVVVVEVGGGFVQGHDPAIDAKGLRQG